MASVKQNLDIVVGVKGEKNLDNLGNKVRSAEKGLGGLGTAARAAAGALAAIGVGKALKGFIDTGRSVENLRLKFKFLFGSATEGAKAFETLSEFASTVPFSLDQIAAASGNLAVVSEDASELGKNLELAGNIAAVSGLDFQSAGEQLQRALSGGIGAADLLREKGITALLGFKQGAKVTAEETAEALERVFGPGGRFGNAAQSLAQTFDGVVSMLGDKLFNFQRVVGQEFVDELTRSFGNLNTFLEQNADKIDTYARALGIGLARAVTASGEAIKFLKDNSDAVLKVMQFIIALKLAAYFLRLASAIQASAVAMNLLNASMLKNPFIKIGIGLGSFVAGLFVAEKAAESLSEKIDSVVDQAKINKLKEAAGAIEDAMIIKTPEEIKNKEEKEREAARQALLQKEEKFIESLGTLGEDALQKNIRLEQERIARLEKLRMTDLDGYQKYTDLITKVEEEAAKERTEIYKKEAEARKAMQQKDIELIKSGKAADIDLTGKTEEEKKQLVIAAGSDLLRQAASQNKKAFQAYKALQIAEALIAGKSAVLGAFATGNKIGGPIVGALFAAGAAGYVASQINAIRSTQYQGREIGGAVAAGQSYVVGEKGPELFTPNTTGSITPNNRFEEGAGGTTINFNISTVDARGFDELLQTRQDLIISLVNRGLTERGRPRLI